MPDPQLEITPIETIPAAAGETVFAIVRSKTSCSSSSEARYIQITMSRQLWAGLVMFGLVTSHLLLWIVIFSFENISWIPTLVITGCALGQSQLLGLWLAISPWALWKRLIAVAAVTSFGVWLPVGDGSLLAVAWTFIGLATLVFSIPRVLLGWRIDFQPEKLTTLPSWRSGGTLLGILGYMLACGLLIAIIQYFMSDFLDDLDIEDWLGVLSMTLPMTMLNAVWTLAIMCPNCRAAKAVAVGVIAAFGLMALAMQQLGQTREFLQQIVYSALTSLPVYAGTLFILRRLGWRLYQNLPPVKKLPEETTSFDSL